MRAVSLLAPLAVCAALLGAASAQAQEGGPAPREPASAERPALVIDIPIHGAIDQVLADTVKRRVDEALKRSPRFLVFDMDTWGGELGAAYEIADRIVKIPKDVTTVAYVSEKAISAGAMISLACSHIAMRPSTRLGDCEPIMVVEEGIETAPEKIKSTLRADFRNYAERNGYPADLAMAMVDKDHEVVRVELRAKDGAAEGAAPEIVYVQARKLEQWPPEEKDRVLRQETAVFKGELLTMNHTQAKAFGFCEWIVHDRAELQRVLEARSGVTLTRTTLETTGWEQFVSFLASPEMRSFFMAVGMLGIMIEFYHPGLLIPGLIGLLSLGLAFFAGNLLGVVDMVDIVLVLVGLALLAIELVVLPGFGVPGILGIVSLVAGLFLSMQSFAIPTTSFEWQALEGNAKVFVFGLGGAVLFFAASLRFLPQSPLLRKLVQVGAQKPEDGYTVGSPARVALLGRMGKVASTLRPSGKILVGDELLDAVAPGAFIDAGRRVTIVGTEGSHVIVEAIDEEVKS